MRLSKQENRTADLYRDVHALVEPEYAKREADVLMAEDYFGVSANYLDGKKCLDVGVGGKGRALRGLFKLGSRDITAIDLSEANLTSAKKANDDIADYIKFKVKNVLELDYPGESFDFIHCNGVIHHTDRPELAVRQLYRCLCSGGGLYVGLYGSGGIIYSAAGLLRLAAKGVPYKMSSYAVTRLFRGTVARDVLDYLYVPHQFHYTDEEARGLLSRTGFINIRRLKQPPPSSRSIWDSALKPSTIDPNTPYGRIMVGTGWIVLLAEKPR